MPRKKLGNTLDKPIKTKAPIPFSLINYEEIERKNKKILIENVVLCSKESVKKLAALLDHYKIDKMSNDRWFFLSLALAKEYVTGFKVIPDKIKTKPIKWSPLKYAALYLEVEMEKKLKKKHTYSSICAQLSRNSEMWKGEKNLQKRHSESKDTALVRALMSAKILPEKVLYDDLINLIKSREVQKPSEF